MTPVVIGALLGAWVVGRRRPTTQLEKKTILGPFSGLTYKVDQFTDAGIIAVTSDELGVTAVFTRVGRGYRYVRGRGNPGGVAQVVHDITGHRPGPSAAQQDSRQHGS